MDVIEMVRLQTVQPLAFLEEVETIGFARTTLEHVINGLKREYPDDPDFHQNFLNAYEWLRQQMQQRVTSLDSQTIESQIYYPIWAWYQFDSHERPFMNMQECEGYTHKSCGMYAVITLEVDARRVLFTDHHDWHAVLDNRHAGDDFSIPVADSWQSIILLYDDISEGRYPDMMIQATLFEVAEADIVDVQYI